MAKKTKEHPYYYEKKQSKNFRFYNDMREKIKIKAKENDVSENSLFEMFIEFFEENDYYYEQFKIFIECEKIKRKVS